MVTKPLAAAMASGSINKALPQGPPTNQSLTMTHQGSTITNPGVSMTPEEFSLETRFVILNFMGLVPTTHLAEHLPVGSTSSWQSSLGSSSSSSGHYRSVSHHSHSSSNSSQDKQEQLLPEFSNEHISRVTAHGAGSENLEVLTKKPLAKSRSLPQDEGGYDGMLRQDEGGYDGTLRQDTTNSNLNRPSKTMLKKQLRKTKSVTTPGESGTVLVDVQSSQRGGGLPSYLRRGSTVDEESEPETEPVINSVQVQEDDFIVSETTHAEEPRLQAPSATPTDQNKLFEVTLGLSLSSGLENSGIVRVDDAVMPPLIPPPHSNGSLHPTSALDMNHSPDSSDAECLQLIAAQFSTASEQKTGGTFRFRGRSQSPARPMTLNLSEVAPRSPGAPNWKDLVCTPQPLVSNNSPDHDKDQDDVDSSHSFRTGSKEPDSPPQGRDPSPALEQSGSSLGSGSPVAQLDGSPEKAGSLEIDSHRSNSLILDDTSSLSLEKEESDSLELDVVCFPEKEGNRPLDEEGHDESLEWYALSSALTKKTGSPVLEEPTGEEVEDGPEQVLASSVSAHGETDQGTSSQSIPAPHRQNSAISTGSSSLPSPLSMLGESGRSWVSSRTSLGELDLIDVTNLVSNHSLPPVAIPLKEELGEQRRQLEQTYSDLAVQAEGGCLTPCPTFDSPQSEVARRLGVIGDAVQAEYGEAIERAIHGVISLPRERITYEVFLSGLVHAGLRRAQVEGWNQVAFVLLFGQRLLLALLQKGERHLRGLFDLLERAINDRAARFIVDQGGWGSLSDSELESPVSITDIATHLLPDNIDGNTSTAALSLSNFCETDFGAVTPAVTISAVLTPTPNSNEMDVTPVSPATVMSASPSDENSNKPSKEVEDTQLQLTPFAVLHNGKPDTDRPTSLSPAPATSSASGHLTPEEMKSIEDAVTSVRHEIQLIRQVSSDLHNELDISRYDNNHRGDNPSWSQVVAVTLLATVGLAILVMFKQRGST